VPTPPPILKGLSEEDQREFLAAGEPRQLQPRDALGEQGEPADLFALVQVGYLKLGQVTPAGVERLVRFVGPGDCYGAVALVANSRFPVSAIAVQPTRVLVWDRPVINAFAERLPQLKSNVLEEITRRMAGVLTAAQELAAERVPQRVAHALLRVAEYGGVRTTEGVRIVHPLTRQELADLTGATLFTVSRLMSQWEAEGLVRSGRGTVTIVDPEGLAAAGDSD
jgi:CRP-like cAMP-binding protein